MLVLLSAALACAAAQPSTAADAPAPPVLETVPAQIISNLSPDAPFTLDVHLKSGAQALSHLTLATFSGDNIAVQLPADQVQVPQLAPDSDYAWSLHLTHVGTLLGAAKLYVRVGFDSAEGRAASSHHLLYASVDIAPPSSISSPTLAKAEVVGGATSVSYGRPAQLLLQLTNQSSRNLRLASVSVFKPAFVGVSLGVAGLDQAASAAEADGNQQQLDLSALRLGEVLPGQTAILPLTVQASSRVVPGQYTVMISAQVATGDLLQSAQVSHEIDVVVLGESDLLKLIGVPSLLFLPGALCVTTLGLLLSMGLSSDDRKKQLLQPTEPAFWLLAIALSLFAALGYPWLTGLWGQRRNYLVSYGLQDFTAIFAWAIAAGFLAWVIYLAARWLVKQGKAWWIRQQVPQPDDQPLAILDKLSKLNLSVTCPQAYPSGGTAADAVLVLEAWSTDTELWLAPPALLAVTLPREDPNYYVALDEQDKLTDGEVLAAKGVAEEVRAHLPARAEGGWWSIEWRAIGAVAKPLKAKPAAWTVLPQRARLLVS